MIIIMIYFFKMIIIFLVFKIPELYVKLTIKNNNSYVILGIIRFFNFLVLKI